MDEMSARESVCLYELQTLNVYHTLILLVDIISV